MKKKQITQYVAIILCATGLMTYTAEGKVTILEQENTQLNKKINNLEKQINNLKEQIAQSHTPTITSFLCGLMGGLTSTYQPLIGRAISGIGVLYYRSVFNSITIGIGHIFGHLLTQTYQSNNNDKSGKKLTYW